jgi:hypothetical protein
MRLGGSMGIRSSSLPPGTTWIGRGGAGASKILRNPRFMAVTLHMESKAMCFKRGPASKLLFVIGSRFCWFLTSPLEEPVWHASLRDDIAPLACVVAAIDRLLLSWRGPELRAERLPAALKSPSPITVAF